MKLRGRLALWLAIVVALAAILFVVPLASDSSWLGVIDEWVEEYNEAVADAQADDDDDEGHDDTDLPVGNMIVMLDDEAQDYAGIETRTLIASSYFPEVQAQARVMDVAALLDARADYNQARAALNVATVAESSAQQELNRLTKLSQGAGSVATKNVNYAAANWRDATAKLQGRQFQLKDVKDQVRQAWGETISAWVIGSDSKPLERLVSRQDSLILVTLPVERTLPAELSFIRIARNGIRHDARKAYFVAPAVSANQIIPGETYYFRTTTGKLRSGMRLDVWLPETTEPLAGVVIPDTAVVWYVGQAWAYVELDEGKYQRRSLKSGINAPGGVFVQQGIEHGETLVLTGSQMLLSEEFRWQIQDEDDD